MPSQNLVLGRHHPTCAPALTKLIYLIGTMDTGHE